MKENIVDYTHLKTPTWFSDTNKIMLMVAWCVETIFTIIKVIAYFTLEATADYRTHVTMVASNFLMMRW